MPILENDILLLQSAVMADVPEGGGGPSRHEVIDGASNAIFADIAETDRAFGHVSIRQLHVAVRTDDTDTLMGLHLTCTPPQDSRVSTTLFADGDLFATRADAVSRLESYLFAGARLAAFLFENHIRGMRAIQLFMHPATEPPPVGRTLWLVQNEGKPNQVAQYVRVTKVTVTARRFAQYDTNGRTSEYLAHVVTLEISDPLAADFTGSPPSPVFVAQAGASLVRDTVVADAARYYGSTRLSEPVRAGDFSFRVQSVYNALVPSSQTEIPLIDYSAAGQGAALIAAGQGDITLTSTVPLSPANVLLVGGGIAPGSLSVACSAGTLTDQGGQLMNGAVSVGTVDYAAGALRYQAGEVGGVKTVRFRAAHAPLILSDSALLVVTQETRSYNWAYTLPVAPAPGMTWVSYMAGGNWYTLRDAGDGILRGSESAFGIGRIDRASHTVSFTAGALPDAGSAVLFFWGCAGNYDDVTASLAANCRAELVLPLPPGSDAGNFALSWPVGDQTLTVGGGNALPPGVGVMVDAAAGEIRLALPTLLPPTTVFALSSLPKGTVKSAGSASAQADSAGVMTARIIEPFRQGSLRLYVTLTAVEQQSGRHGQVYRDPDPYVVRIEDDGAGKLICRTTGTEVGSVDYPRGELLWDSKISVPFTYRVLDKTQYKYKNRPDTGELYDTGRFVFETLGQCTPADAAKVQVSYIFDHAPDAPSVTAAVQATLRIRYPVGMAQVAMLRFSLGGENYYEHDGQLWKRLADGQEMPVGRIDYASGTVTLDAWSACDSAVTVQAALLRRGNSRLVSSAAFRVPAAPLRPGSLQIRAVRASGLGTISAVADADGRINGPQVQGEIDVQTGVCHLRFGREVDAASAVDQPWYDASKVVDGKIWESFLVLPETLLYNATAYTYLPVDAATLGINPVRLPPDGRVPVFRRGELVVLSNRKTVPAATVSNGQTLNCGRERLSRLRVVGADGVVIRQGYQCQLDAGTVTFTDVSGYAQPVTVEHYIEDLAQMTDVQIDGTISVGAAITHAYAPGDMVSSALFLGNQFARVAAVFDQESWDGKTWSNTLVGLPASATYNTTLAPVVVSNRGAITERFALRFANNTEVEVIGEHVGYVGRYPIAADIAPPNPISGNAPYFTLRAAGWGGGWTAGNVLFIRCVGAMAPFYAVRTVQKGMSGVVEDGFCVVVRGNVDRP